MSAHSDHSEFKGSEFGSIDSPLEVLKDEENQIEISLEETDVRSPEVVHEETSLSEKIDSEAVVDQEHLEESFTMNSSVNQNKIEETLKPEEFPEDDVGDNENNLSEEIVLFFLTLV